MAKAIGLVKDKKADAVISRGNTGGLFTASTVLLRPIENVKRGAIAIVIPSQKNEFVLLDAGALQISSANRFITANCTR